MLPRVSVDDNLSHFLVTDKREMVILNGRKAFKFKDVSEDMPGYKLIMLQYFDVIRLRKKLN